jgi:hypothetical protein
MRTAHTVSGMLLLYSVAGSIGLVPGSLRGLSATHLIIQCGPFDVSSDNLSNLFTQLRNSGIRNNHPTAELNIASLTPFRLNATRQVHFTSSERRQDDNRPTLVKLLVNFK